jgi:hypothetical protein
MTPRDDGRPEKHIFEQTLKKSNSSETILFDLKIVPTCAFNSLLFNQKKI